MSKSANGRKRKRKMILWWSIGSTVVLIVAAYVVLLSPISILPKSNQNEIQGTAAVEAKSVNQTVVVTGNVEPIATQTLVFPASGQLSRLPIQVGQRVRKGEVLAALDDTQARYNLKTVENNIETTRLTGSAKSVQLLEIQRQIDQKTLDQMTIVSTLDGVVGTLSSGLSAGDYIAGQQEFGTVIDVSTLKAVVEVDELDVPKIKVGQEVDFRFDALPTLNVIGTVSSIPPLGTVNNQGIAVMDVTLMIKNPPPEIVPSFSFNADIIIEKNVHILVLESQAVVNQNGETFALVEKPGQSPALVPIKVTPYEAGTEKVLSGLTEGEKVLVLKPNARSAPARFGFFGMRGGPGHAGGPPPGGDRRPSSTAFAGSQQRSPSGQ